MPVTATYPPLPAFSPRISHAERAARGYTPSTNPYAARAHLGADSPDNPPPLPHSVDVALLLTHLARGEMPRDCADSHGIPLETFLPWLEHPATLDRIARLRDAEALRAHHQRACAASSAREICRLTQQLKLPPPDAPIVDQLRAAEAAFKAAIAILYPRPPAPAPRPPLRIPALIRRLLARIAPDAPARREQFIAAARRQAPPSPAPTPATCAPPTPRAPAAPPPPAHHHPGADQHRQTRADAADPGKEPAAVDIAHASSNAVTCPKKIGRSPARLPLPRPAGEGWGEGYLPYRFYKASLPGSFKTPTRAASLASSPRRLQGLPAPCTRFSAGIQMTAHPAGPSFPAQPRAP